MAATFLFELISPEGIKARAEVESLVLPGQAGSLGVLLDHEPWTVMLRAGEVKYRPVGEDWRLASIGGGVASIEGTRTVVLADSIAQ